MIPLKLILTNGQPTALGEWRTGDTLPISHGGTGAADAAGARSALGLANHEKVEVDAGGNVGIGVTPSAWRPLYAKAIQVGDTGAALSAGTAALSADQYLHVCNNGYTDSDGAWVYARSKESARYEQFNGSHKWLTAASGAAGSAITWTQAMTLDASNKLTCSGQVSANGMHLQGASAIYAAAEVGGRLWRPAQKIGSAEYSGLFGLCLTYLADYNGGWKSTGGGTATALTIDEGIFSIHKSQCVAGPGEALTWTTELTVKDGNLLVGAGSGSFHRFAKYVAEGVEIFQVDNLSNFTAEVYSVSGSGAATSACAIRVNKTSTTGRSINAAGTINASGADYAEYERTRNEFIGKILKGAIVGFDVDGKLTLSFDEAISFGVKSTDPCMVGGDVWGTEEALGMKRPEQPQDDASDDDKAAYQKALAKFEAALEAARQQVDRIAYSGKVPCNVYDAKPGDYIVAVRDIDGGIAGVAVAKPTFEQYQNTVGRVRRIEADGRANIAVMVH